MKTKIRTISLRITAQDSDLLDATCAREEKSITNLILDLLYENAGVKRDGKKEKK